MKQYLLLIFMAMGIFAGFSQTRFGQDSLRGSAQTELLIASSGRGTASGQSTASEQSATSVQSTLSDPVMQSVPSGQVSEELSLLPRHMMLTQRILWGEKGLMRNFKTFELSEAGRDREMEIRSKMLFAHEYLGYATLAAMAGECVVGIMLYNGKNVSDLHEGLAGFTNTCYFSTAALALFTPPRMKDRPAGWSSAKLHKTLAVMHFAGMIATNILGGMSEHNHTMAKYHRAAAIATFASYFAATVVIKL